MVAKTETVRRTTRNRTCQTGKAELPGGVVCRSVVAKTASAYEVKPSSTFRSWE